MFPRVGFSKNFSMGLPARELLDDKNDVYFRRLILLKSYLSFHPVRLYRLDDDPLIPSDFHRTLETYGVYVTPVADLQFDNLHKLTKLSPANDDKQTLFVSGLEYIRIPAQVYLGVQAPFSYLDQIMTFSVSHPLRLMRFGDTVSFDEALIIPS